MADQADRRHPEQRRAARGALGSPPPRSRHCTALAALLVLAAGAARGQTPAPDRPPGADSTPAQRRLARPRITHLEIDGVRALSRGALLNSIATTASHCKSILLTPFCLITKSHFFYEKDYLDRVELARDVLRIKIYYWQRGYRETTVDTVVTPPLAPAVRVAFVVHEGPPTTVSAVSFAPESLFSRKQRATLIGIRVGDPLNVLVVDSSRRALRSALWRRGYADAVVDTTLGADSSAHTGTVAYQADPKRVATIGAIRITGNERIDSTTIRHGLRLEPGHVLYRADIARSQRALYQSNLFRRAAITFAPDSGQPDSVKVVQVTVAEAPLHAVEGTVGLNQINFVQLGARYTNYDWLGNARQLDVNLGVGNLLATALDNHIPFYDVAGLAQKGDPLNTAKYLQPTWDASANVLQPWLGSPDNSVGGGIFDHRHSFPGVYVDNGYGAQAAFTRTLAEHVSASLTYRYELTQVSASQVYFCVDYGACDQPTIALLQGRRALSPLALSAKWDATDGSLSPSTGALARVEFQHASQFTLSDYRYNRAYASGSVYRQVLRHSVLAFHAEAGWVHALPGGIDTGALHPRTRFYAGGAESVRGFGENQLGPEVLTIADSALGAVCGMPINPATCNPNGTYVVGGKTIRIPNSAFTPRPLGGNTLLEGSVELRFPLAGPIGGATFVDAGYVGQQALKFVAQGQGAVTPGAGLRYYSPVGPIRLDLGFNPWQSRSVPVVTQVGTGRTATIIEMGTLRSYTPPGFFNALVLHLSIGQAF